VQCSSWAHRLDLVGDDDRLVGFAGVLPLRLLVERTGLRAGLSRAMHRRGFDPVYAGVHPGFKITNDLFPLATALADEVRRDIAELGWLAADLRARAAALDLRADDDERAAARAVLLLAMP